MLFLKSTLLAAATMLAMLPLVANAHMIMENPVPYGTQEQKNLKDPLKANRANFPCRNPSYTISQMNEWPVGSLQTVKFQGTAAHGGGSCQVSVTTDKQPNKDSKWKVIYSVEGGCITSAQGNLQGTDANKSPESFTFNVPEELHDGEMSMALTWFNKVGNREMYMYCAPIKVTGGAKDTTAFNTLPDMAVANMDKTCETLPGNDYTFENPGKYKIKGGTGPFSSLCGGKPATGNDPPVAPVPQQPAPQQPAAPSQPSANPGIPTTAPAAPQVSALTSTLRTILTVTAPVGSAPTGSPGNASTPPAKPPTAQPSKSAAQAPAASSASAPAAPAPSNTNGQSCPTDGAVVCRGDSEFGLCNHGKVVFQPVAQGTVCKNGAIAKRDNYVHRNMRTAI